MLYDLYGACYSTDVPLTDAGGGQVNVFEQITTGREATINSVSQSVKHTAESIVYS